MATKPSKGDMTGREKARLNKEQMEVQKERSAQISMATAEADDAEQYGTFDPRTGQRINDDGTDFHEVEAVEEEVFDAPNFGSEPVFTGKELPDEIAPVIAARKLFTKRRFETASSPFVLVRVDADVEDMTYGMLNGVPDNYNFKEGLQYKMTRDLAEHLNERGLVRQLTEINS